VSLRVSAAGTPVFVAGWKVVGGSWGCVGTLLGPEGTGVGCLAFLAVCWSNVVRRLSSLYGPAFWWWGARGLWMGRCPYLENCTVDASIFVAN